MSVNGNGNGMVLMDERKNIGKRNPKIQNLVGKMIIHSISHRTNNIHVQ
jgi:hypothetical protein